MGTPKRFVLLSTLLKHSFASNFFSKLKARVVTPVPGNFFLVLLGCPVRDYSAPKALPISCRWLAWEHLGACWCCDPMEHLLSFSSLWSVWKHLPKHTRAGQHCPDETLYWLRSLAYNSQLWNNLPLSKSLHLFCRNELGKIRWHGQAAPKLPRSLSIPCARGTFSFCARKAAQGGQRRPLGASLSERHLFLLCPWGCDSRRQQHICTITKKK